MLLARLRLTGLLEQAVTRKSSTFSEYLNNIHNCICL